MCGSTINVGERGRTGVPDDGGMGAVPESGPTATNVRAKNAQWHAANAPRGSGPNMPLVGLAADGAALHDQGVQHETTDELVEALVDPNDDTLVGLRAALLRELAADKRVHARNLADVSLALARLAATGERPHDRDVILDGVPVPERHVGELVRRMRDAGFGQLADRLTATQERQTSFIALTINEREQILGVLDDPSDALTELRGVLSEEQE
jgi:hypothetical protein